ncbi:NAD(P)/FAD-dependent oxidoreductase [Mesosutterella multiformis]|uniref:NAD(P)/FAD-dependent oxidoreductase n=1 Tax=Mesosutterella multiformis TaxID=2259133 RepID=UPI00278C3E8F|nr:FAD-dependent oxidoreductase [Mesosutterella multiformis]
MRRRICQRGPTARHGAGGWGQLELDGGGYIVAGETTETSIPGVYAVGDVRTKPLRQVVTAVADGAVAVHMAEKYIAENR